MRIAAHVVIGVVCLGLTSSVAVGEVQFGPVQLHKGTCEPSGAVALPEGSVDGIFIVASDEDNTLRAYRPTGGDPLPMTGGNLKTFLGLDVEADNDNKADFEAATWLNGKAYWIGSHSRSGKGRLRSQRWQFFATTLSVQAGKPVVTPASAKSFNGLLAAIAALDPRLEKAIRLDVDKDEGLAPDNGGFNIEGLTARADGKSVLLGLRSPLLGGEAVLIPLQDPDAVIAGTQKPHLGSPIKVDLGGRGIRSIEYSAAAGAYFIVAGPAGKGSGTFDLFRWPRDEKTPPIPVEGFAAGLQKLDPARPFRLEAMVVDATGKKLHIFSDDDDKLCDKSAPTFRSFAVTIE
jgi:hypothetical protein